MQHPGYPTILSKSKNSEPVHKRKGIQPDDEITDKKGRASIEGMSDDPFFAFSFSPCLMAMVMISANSRRE
jgi:hypothetical protein